MIAYVLVLAACFGCAATQQQPTAEAQVSSASPIAAPAVDAQALPTAPAATPTVDDILARPETVGDFLRLHRVVVTVRYTSEDRPETQITMGSTDDEQLHVVVIEGLGEPLYEQLKKTNRPRFARFELSDSASFRALLRRLLEMRVNVEPTHTMYVHADLITIWVSTIVSEFMFEFSVRPEDHEGGYWGDLKETHPLIQWAYELRKVAVESRRADMRTRP